MKAGDKVKLVKSVGFYQAGASGIITSMATVDVANVSLDKDSNGVAINPPDPIPPQRTDYFLVVG